MASCINSQGCRSDLASRWAELQLDIKSGLGLLREDVSLGVYCDRHNYESTVLNNSAYRLMKIQAYLA